MKSIRKIGIVLFLLPSCAALAAEPSGSPKVREVLKQAEALMQAGRHAEALDLARQALSSGPERKKDRVKARVVLCQAKNALNVPFQEPASPGEDRCAPRDPEEGIRLASGASVPAGKEVARPEKLFGRVPRVPEEVRSSTKRGVSVVSTVIDEEGCVRDVRVCEGDSEAFNQAARESFRGWVFEPATLDGTPVAVYYKLTAKLSVYP
ncbi:MAG TPA: TonB family protein [Thermoanaerobaculia bacterium]|nr:TonB family protein [Thermoanaerobaculia bacterium]